MPGPFPRGIRSGSAFHIHCWLKGEMGTMMTRRTFLRTGVASGDAILPLSSGAAFAGAEVIVEAAHIVRTGDASAGTFIPLPSRLPAATASEEPLQKHVRRVGQTNV